jgi:hypothetical protein
LDESIAALTETLNLLSARRDAPTTTLNDERLILQEMANVNAELQSHEFLRLHLRRMQTIVTAPTQQTGQQSAAALQDLQQMRNATATFTNFTDLFATFIVKMSDHRREVDVRTSDD